MNFSLDKYPEDAEIFDEERGKKRVLDSLQLFMKQIPSSVR